MYMKQYHYIYQVTSPSGKFYIGRHSTYNINDGYIGSGKWVSSMSKHKQQQLTKKIIEMCDSYDEVVLREQHYINQHINNSLNMNFNNNPVGFPSGDYHPSKVYPDFMHRVVQTRIANGTNYHSEETKRKLSLIKIGVPRGTPSWNSGKTKENDMRIAALGQKISSTLIEINRALTAEQRAALYGHCGENNPFYGKTHNSNTVEKIKSTRSKTLAEKKQCPHCNKIVESVNYARWHGDNCKLVKDNRKLCPHCNKKVSAPNFARWHGDNCKQCKQPEWKT